MKENFKYRTIFDNAPISMWEEDGSEVKKSLDALKKQIGEDKIRSYLDNNPEYVIKLANSVKIHSVNKKTIELYEGNSIDDFKKRITDTFTESSLDCFKNLLVAIFKGENFYCKESVAKTFKGNFINIMVQISIPEEDIDLKHIIVSMTDLTAIRKLEKEIENSLEKFKNLIEATKTAYIIMSENGEIQEVNDVLLEILACQSNCFGKNTSIFNLVSKDDEVKLHRALLHLKKGIPIEDLEICLNPSICEKKGIWIRMNANILDGISKNVFCLVKDITAKKIEEFSKYISNQKQKDRVRQNISRIRYKIQNMNTNLKGREND